MYTVESAYPCRSYKTGVTFAYTDTEAFIHVVPYLGSNGSPLGIATYLIYTTFIVGQYNTPHQPQPAEYTPLGLYISAPSLNVEEITQRLRAGYEYVKAHQPWLRHLWQVVRLCKRDLEQFEAGMIH